MNKESNDILIVVAHPSEEEAVRQAAANAGCGCEIIVTGVGGAAMTWALQKRFAMGAVRGAMQPAAAPGQPGSPQHSATPGQPGSPQHSAAPGQPGSPQPSTKPRDASSGKTDGQLAGGITPALVIGAGIAGSYVESLVTGSVVVALSDCFADMGVDDNGHFIPLFSAGLAAPDTPPFSDGRIICSGRWFELATQIMHPARAATVNMASGSLAVIERIRKTWDPEIETMEGAWMAYTCALSGIPWLSVRAVSNRVEPRNLKNWDIPLALGNLQEKMTGLLRLIAKEMQY